MIFNHMPSCRIVRRTEVSMGSYLGNSGVKSESQTIPLGTGHTRTLISAETAGLAR